MVGARPALPRLETKRLVLRVGGEEDAAALLDYVVRNRQYHARWEPRVAETFYTLGAQRRVIQRRIEDFACGDAACFLLFDRAAPDRVIGRCNYTEIVRGPFQACYLGYSIDREYEGKGFMAEALRRTLEWVFGELHLHRVMANHRPENERSARLLQRLGFTREGYAKDYLYIDGRWTDHVLTALVNPRPEPTGIPQR
jgi:[ribosomal protein S5]-alanine N-acetyltransferase